jgi:hypothetical protein
MICNVATDSGQRRVQPAAKREIFEKREVGRFVADGARQRLISDTKRTK